MKEVADKAFAIWEFLRGNNKHAYTVEEIRLRLLQDGSVNSEVRHLTKKEIRNILSLLGFNKLVKRFERRGKIYWRGIEEWRSLKKKHGGYYA